MIRTLIPGDPSVSKRIAFLVSNKEFKLDELNKNYFTPLELQGIDRDEIIVYNLKLNAKGKIPMGKAREYLGKLQPILESQDIEHVVVCNGTYFKALTKVRKVDPNIGYTLRSDMWPDVSVYYLPGYSQMYFDSQVGKKISLALQGIAASTKGEICIFDQSLTENVIYALTVRDIKKSLLQLLQYKELAYDIETFGLKVDEAGIGTIAFAPDTKSSIVFSVDYGFTESEAQTVRGYLREFFEAYQGTLKPHGGTFDAKVLIWNLWMNDAMDIEGMVDGLDVMFRHVEDTHTLSYLALNSTSGNKLKLKELAYEFTGNYALEDIKDITKYPVREVLEYNAIDAMATNWVHDQYRCVVRNTQEQVYQQVFRPSERTITQMELCGLPMSLTAVLLAEKHLQDVHNSAEKVIRSSPIISEFEDAFRELTAIKETAKLKKLVKTADDYLHISFNPDSTKQLQLLLYQGLGLPIIKETDTGQPATGKDILAKLVEHEKTNRNRPEVIELLEALVLRAEAEKILTSFIPAFKEKGVDKDGWLFLLGCFNLGGTVSGRLSSSNPNMQNLPSTGTSYAEIIKQCFMAPESGDWILVGADYFSLEDRISALQTRDPNKLKVYTDGYDGHCLRAYAYFSSQMPDITSELANARTKAQRASVINSIEKRYPKLRQFSKGPTFALTYGGTWKTLNETFGIPIKEAKAIEKEYHELYKVSDDWVKAQMKQANVTGYVELAFGLRLRTPGIQKVVWGSDSLPYEVKKEIKTAGNALGQSYGLLNSYSANKFMERVWAHPKYRTQILPCAQIHDSQYYLIRNTLGCIKWVNDNLVECMEWCDLPELKHSEVGLGSELEIFYPSWAEKHKVPNGASLKDIRKICDDATNS